MPVEPRRQRDLLLCLDRERLRDNLLALARDDDDFRPDYERARGLVGDCFTRDRERERGLDCGAAFISIVGTFCTLDEAP
jgi:hypothetical protein